jgi:hypothetical protein
MTRPAWATRTHFADPINGVQRAQPRDADPQP